MGNDLLIGILSILTTVLIGWQVVNYITIDRRIAKKVTNLVSEHWKLMERDMLQREIEMRYLQLESYLQCQDWYKVIVVHESFISLIEPLSRYGDSVLIRKYIEYTRNLINHYPHFNDTEMKRFELFTNQLKQLFHISNVSIANEFIDLYLKARVAIESSQTHYQSS